MCERKHGYPQAKFEALRSKLDECENKTRTIFERCSAFTLGAEPVMSNSADTIESRDASSRPIQVERALIVQEEYLSMILSGLKREEIRSKWCSPGWTALCSCSVIYGVAEILSAVEETDAVQYLVSWESWRRHRIGSKDNCPSETMLKSKVANFLSEIGVNSRGHYYLKYWPWPHESPRIYRWCLGRVFRTCPIRMTTRAYSQTWIKLDSLTSSLICESLTSALPQPPAQMRLPEDKQVDRVKGVQVASRFFPASASPRSQERSSAAPTASVTPSPEDGCDPDSDAEWLSAFDEPPAESDSKRPRMSAARRAECPAASSAACRSESAPTSPIESESV
jgi:hypothetical protein